MKPTCPKPCRRAWPGWAAACWPSWPGAVSTLVRPNMPCCRPARPRWSWTPAAISTTVPPPTAVWPRSTRPWAMPRPASATPRWRWRPGGSSAINSAPGRPRCAKPVSSASQASEERHAQLAPVLVDQRIAGRHHGLAGQFQRTLGLGCLCLGHGFAQQFQDGHIGLARQLAVPGLVAHDDLQQLVHGGRELLAGEQALGEGEAGFEVALVGGNGGLQGAGIQAGGGTLEG